MALELFDTHCHLDVLQGSSTEEILARAKAQFVTKVISIGAGNGIESPARSLALAEKYENVYAAVAIHPQEVGKFSDLSRLRPFLSHPKVVALGETGLDYYRDWGAPEHIQIRVFEESIQLAKEFKKPLIIHCRDVVGETRAADGILERLISGGAASVGGVFHCYPMDEKFAESLAKINFLVSFPGVLTFKSAHSLREIAARIPLEQIMLETDAPYMAPEPFRGKPSEPAHVRQIAEQLAKIKNISLERVGEVTSANARRLFRLV